MAKWWWDDDDVSLFPYVVFFNETSVFCFFIFVFSVDWLTEEIIDRPLFCERSFFQSFVTRNLTLVVCLLSVNLYDFWFVSSFSVWLCISHHLHCFLFLFSPSHFVSNLHTQLDSVCRLSAILYQIWLTSTDKPREGKTCFLEERDETFVMQMFVFSMRVSGWMRFFLRRE